MLIHVELTTEDIARGNPASPTECAVALALRRAVPTHFRVTVGVDMAFISDDRRSVEVALPVPVRHWIMRALLSRLLPIPLRWQCRPFAFDLDVPLPDGAPDPC